MYLFNEQKIFQDFPFLMDGKNVIINFISLDSVPDINLNSAIYCLYPELKDKIFNLLYDDKINQDNILPFTKNQRNQIIINIPFKDSYNDTIIIDYIINGLKKSEALLDNKKYDKIIISSTQINQDIFNQIIKETNLKLQIK